MKKTNLLILLAALALVGCSGNKTTSTNVESKGEAPSSQTTSQAPVQGYDVTVKNEAGEKFTDGTIYAKWCTDDNCFMPIEVKDGYAYNKILSSKEASTYYVHFDYLDESKYTYNPNLQATPEEKSLDVTIYSINSIVDNKISTGVYKVSVSMGQYTSLTLDTTNKGKYIVESWIDYGPMTSTQLNVDPSIYMNDTLLDDNSGYKNNFKAEIQTTEANEVTLQFSANATADYYFIVTYIA